MAFINEQGYVKVYKKDHPRSNKTGYVYEHILVVENMIGRPLKEDEIVHHINEVKHDNEPINLTLLTKSEHMAIHRLLEYERFKMKNLSKMKFLYLDCEMNTREVAEEIGCSKSVVAKVLKEAGVTREQKKRRKITNPEKVIEMYLEGMTQVYIAEHFGVSRIAVRPILVEAGLLK
jgi:HNH endonuclease